MISTSAEEYLRKGGVSRGLGHPPTMSGLCPVSLQHHQRSSPSIHVTYQIKAGSVFQVWAMQLSFLDSFRAVPKDVPCDTVPCGTQSVLRELKGGGLLLLPSLHIGATEREPRAQATAAAVKQFAMMAAHVAVES